MALRKDTALALTASQPPGWEAVRASLWALQACHSRTDSYAPLTYP
ncbi:hypothetical protein [Nostoc sp.]